MELENLDNFYFGDGNRAKESDGFGIPTIGTNGDKKWRQW